MGLRPYISDSGANSNGPEAKPIRNVLTPRVETVVEQSRSLATAVMAAVWIDEQKATMAVMTLTRGRR